MPVCAEETFEIYTILGYYETESMVILICLIGTCICIFIRVFLTDYLPGWVQFDNRGTSAVRTRRTGNKGINVIIITYHHIIL